MGTPALVLSTLAIVADAKTFDRCQLARLFLHKYDFPMEHIDDCT